MRSGVGSRAPVSANSPIQVVPIIDTSGVSPAAIAVEILSCAASHGIAVTLISASGFSSTNAAAKSPSFSPSVPIAQTSMAPEASPSATSSAGSAAGPADPPSPRPQPASPNAATASAAVPIRTVLFMARPPR